MVHEELTEKIFSACFEVSNELGCGFLESVYEKALLIALADKDLKVVSQVPLRVEFRGKQVGDFFADLVVEDKVLLELKAVKGLAPEHTAQLLNYLKATGIEVGLLINFGNTKLEYRRYNNNFKRLILQGYKGYKRILLKLQRQDLLLGLIYPLSSYSSLLDRF